MKGGEVLSNARSVSVEMTVWCLPFILLVHHVSCFSRVEPPLHSWGKSHMVSSVVCIFLEICPSYLGYTYSS